MREEVEIIPGPAGTLVARCTWGHIVLEESLPKGIETWPEEERNAHMRRFVAPLLKAKMGRARAGHLPLDQMAAPNAGIVTGYKVAVPKNETEARLLMSPEELSKLPESDKARIAKAEAKRARKAKKASN